MKLLRHLIAADLKRHRLLLAVWLFVVASKAIIDGVQPTLAGDAALSRIAGLLGFVLGMAELLLMIVLVPLLVHTHPLVGSDAFWMTRPIPPQTLLAGKALLLAAAVVGLPVVAEALLMGAYLVPPPRILAVAAGSALFRTFWLVLLMTAAALTPNMPRFALFCGGVPGRTGRRPRDHDGDPAGEVRPVASEVRRRRHRGPDIGSRAAGVGWRGRCGAARRAGTGPARASGPFWREERGCFWLSSWPRPGRGQSSRQSSTRRRGLQTSRRSALARRAGTVQVKEMPAFFGRSSWMLAQARVSVAGIEPRWSAQVGVLEATLQLDGSNRLVSVGSSFPTAVSVDPHEPHPTRGVMRRLLGVQRLVDPAAPPTDSTTVFFVRDAELQKLAPASGTYEGRFQVRLTRHDLEATLPVDETPRTRTARIVSSSLASSARPAASRLSRASRTRRRCSTGGLRLGSVFIFGTRTRASPWKEAATISPTSFSVGVPAIVLQSQSDLRLQGSRVS